MSKIGYICGEVEEGWKRIDCTDNNFEILNFNFRSNLADNNSTSYITQKQNSTIKFVFYGSFIRIIGAQGSIFGTSTVIIDDKEYQTINNTSFTDKYQIVIFEKTDLKKQYHSITIKTNSSNYFIFDCIDIDSTGNIISQEEYLTFCYIKMNNKYYSFSSNNYNTQIKMYNEITLDDINNCLYSDKLINFVKEITINDETFKPIDKFDNFSIIRTNNKSLKIMGRKNKSGLIITPKFEIGKNAEIKNIRKIIPNFNLSNNSNIKVVFSFDEGTTWKTYSNDSFSNLSINIKNIKYSDMTNEEKSDYNNAKTIILNNGVDISDLINVNFNIPNLNVVVFAIALYEDNIDDNCDINSFYNNFDKEDKMEKMKNNEFTENISDGIITINPLIDSGKIITNYKIR